MWWKIKQIGTDQGNCLFGVEFCNQSCLIFQKIEKDNLGVMTCRLMQNEKYQIVVIAFVDETYFLSNEKHFEKRWK